MRVLLIDGDIIAYKAAVLSEKAVDWGDGVHTLHAEEGDGHKRIIDTINRLMDKLSASEMRVALSDPDPTKSFRKKLLPSYKSHRTGRKPIILAAMKQYLVDNYAATIVPWLEGDDVMGIWSTHPGVKGEKIIVSIDKDMKTIPGLVFNPDKDDAPREISLAEADRWHLLQTLTGDTSDGYSGCPDVGKVKAAEILDDPHTLVETTKTTRLTKEPSVVWKKGEPCDVWTAIVHQYRKAGFGEDFALTQARVARILRADGYNSKTKKVNLWNPTATQ